MSENVLPNTDQYFQMQVQRTSDEMMEQIEKLNTPKEFIKFHDAIIQNLNTRKDLLRDSLSHKKLKKKYLKLEKYFFNFEIIEFFIKCDFFFHPFELRLFTENELQMLKKNILENEFLTLQKIKNEKITKSYLNKKVKNCIECFFQELLLFTKYENIYKEIKTYELFNTKYIKFQTFLFYFYFLNVFECCNKINNMLYVLKTLQVQNNVDTQNEYLEYEIELLNVFYNNLNKMDNILSIGVIENVNINTCIDTLDLDE